MITLTEDLRIGHPNIDQDHQRLVGIINEFLEQANAGDNSRIMHETLKSLLVYSREHFQREEKIQRECMYPYAPMHMEEHKRLISQVEDMARTYFIVKATPIDGTAIKEMNDLLKVWLVDHIKKFDTNMRDWVAPADQG